MKVTRVYVERKVLENNPIIRGFASIEFDNCFVVKNLRLIENEKGLFVAMPSRKKSDGKWEDSAHPITQECRTMIEKAVWDAYEKAEENGSHEERFE